MVGLKEEEKRKEMEALKNQRYLKALLHQIQENETARIHVAERKEEVGTHHTICSQAFLSILI